MPFKRDSGESLASHEIDLTQLFKDAVDGSGKSRYALSKELGVSEAALSRPYTGKGLPSLELLCDVAAAAGLQVHIELRKPKRKG